jgi:hypothetical protein
MSGGMGVVYIVLDLQNGEKLAAKTYRQDIFASNPAIAARFEREALAWIKLGAHSNIVQAKFCRTHR